MVGRARLSSSLLYRFWGEFADEEGKKGRQRDYMGRERERERERHGCCCFWRCRYATLFLSANMQIYVAFSVIVFVPVFVTRSNFMW